MANRLGYETLQLPSFSDSNQANAQALSLALKGAQFEETQRVQEQQNILGQQLGQQLLAGKDGNVNQSDLLGLALNSGGSVKENLGILSSLQNLLGSSKQAGKLTDVEKQLFKTKKDQDTLDFKQQKDDRARFANLPKRAEEFAIQQTSQIGDDLFCSNVDRDSAHKIVRDLYMETGGEPDLVKALLPSVQEGLYDSQSFLQPFGGYEFNNQQVAKEGRAALANALQLRNKRKT